MEKWHSWVRSARVLGFGAYHREPQQQRGWGDAGHAEILQHPHFEPPCYSSNPPYTHDLRSLRITGLKGNSGWKKTQQTMVLRASSSGFLKTYKGGENLKTYRKSFSLCLVWSALAQLLPIVPHSPRLWRARLYLPNTVPIVPDRSLAVVLPEAWCHLEMWQECAPPLSPVH